MKEVDTAVDYVLLSVSSPAFGDGGMIPPDYSCDGKNISPPIDVDNIPAEARCLALIMDDPDAPRGTWVHWVVWNIPVTHRLEENNIHGVQGVNDFHHQHYGGPCPPSPKPHRYYFKLYALNALLDLPARTNKKQLEKSMSDHILGYGELMGFYQRKEQA
jgi:Raf kinase inhibitor-like YbhB/YbcL family protein